MRAFYTLLVVLSFFFSSVTLGQAIQLKGTVITESGESLITATVLVKGTGAATTTNNLGAFIIPVFLPDTLIISMVGFEKRILPVGEKDAKTSLKITLTSVSTALSEVVVTGYGTMAKMSASAGGIRIRGISSLAPSAADAKSVRSKDVSYSSTPIALDKEVPLTNKVVSRSKILTAGELSDFKKWKLWSDYSKNDFKTWSNHWGLVLEKRYCVQLQNGDRKALVGEKVFLINNETNDTTWSAVTDNTGKAELWSTDTVDNQRGDYSIRCKNKSINNPVDFENGINRITLSQPCNNNNTVDIAFVVDATGSMGDEIHYLQEELQDILSKTSETYSNLNLRTGAVFYRDRGDEYLTRYHDFASNSAGLLSFIERQSANGGGDFPEAVEDALTTAIDSMHWSHDAKAKILFLILDAPPHDHAKTRMFELMKKAAERGIRIVPVVCSGIDKSTEYLMRCIALATNGSYVFLTDDSGIGNPHIKPTTDHFTVEILNALLQRLIGEMIYTPDCGETSINGPVTENTIDDLKISLYPNPTNGIINISFTGPITEILIADFAGKVLMRPSLAHKGKSTVVNLSNYPSGTYLVKYYAADKGWGAKKVMLLH